MIPGLPRPAGEKILALLRGYPGVERVVLFGSRAKGNYREGSDIDIALRGQALSQKDRDALLLKYEDLFLPWKLDLVLYDRIEEPALREHIDRVGQSLL